MQRQTAGLTEASKLLCYPLGAPETGRSFLVGETSPPCDITFKVGGLSGFFGRFMFSAVQISTAFGSGGLGLSWFDRARLTSDAQIIEADGR
jgi:hypothetical protein